MPFGKPDISVYDKYAQNRLFALYIAEKHSKLEIQTALFFI